MDLQTYQMKGKEDGARVQGVQLTEQNVQEVARWCRGLLVVPDSVQVETFRGVITAHIGDYIVRDQLGETHVRKALIFERVFARIDGINGHDFLIDMP